LRTAWNNVAQKARGSTPNGVGDRTLFASEVVSLRWRNVPACAGDNVDPVSPTDDTVSPPKTHGRGLRLAPVNAAP